MKCVLIIPPWKPAEIFSSRTAASQINYWQPLGTLYVAAAMIKAGHKVRLLDGAFLNDQQILQRIAEYTPRFAGIYSTTFGWEKTRKIAGKLKKRHPEIFIAAGGPFPIVYQEKCLEECLSLDAVVSGEGEVSVVEMLEKLENGHDLSAVKGIVYRKQGKIQKNKPQDLILKLDEIPFPARHLLGDKEFYIPPPATYKRKPVAVVLTSRGCNRKCLFCFQIDKERKSGIRYRSVENVLTEIEQCLEQGYKEIKFIDDTLAADYGRAMRIAEEIIRRKLDFTWFASSCVNQVKKPLLQAFKEAGCWAILFGAESGVQKNLDAVRKGITLAQTRQAVSLAKEVGLKVFTPFIFGIPGETFAEGLKTIEFACEINPDVANFHALTPFPGTEIYDNFEKYGTISKDFSEFTYQGASFVPHTMTRDQILKLRQIAFRRFYSRPRFLLLQLFSLRNLSDIKAAIIGLRSLFYLWITKDLWQKGR